jgi:hypothetical protein
MAIRPVKKLTFVENEIGGLKIARANRAAIAYGVIEGTDYNYFDVLVFGINSNDIIDARITAHAPNPSVVEILPGTNLEEPIDLFVDTNDSAPVKLSYVIHYVQGTGKVGNLDNDNPGEGKLLQIRVTWPD